jgi:hypothetical protein
MNRHILSFFIVCSFGSCFAEQGSFNSVSRLNQNPLVSIYGLPSYFNSEINTDSDAILVSSFNWSNTYYESPTTLLNESYIIDTENLQLSLQYIAAITKNLEIGIDVSFVSSSAGSLDSFINDWHDTFNLVDHGRDDREIDLYEISFIQNGETLLSVSEEASGVSDTNIFIGYQLLSGQSYPYRKLALRFNWNIPTGDSTTLSGSGSNDLSAWVDYSQMKKLWDYEFALSLSSGLLTISGAEVLADHVNKVIGFSKFRLSTELTHHWSVNASLNMHTPFYHLTKIKALNGIGVEVDTGGQYSISPRHSIFFGLVEDINVGVSTDVNFYLGYVVGIN